MSPFVRVWVATQSPRATDDCVAPTRRYEDHRSPGFVLQRRHTLGMVVPRFLPEADTPAHWVFLPARSFTFQRRQQLVLVHPHSSDWGRYTLLHTYPRAVGSHFYILGELTVCLFSSCIECLLPL